MLLAHIELLFISITIIALIMAYHYHQWPTVIDFWVKLLIVILISLLIADIFYRLHTSIMNQKKTLNSLIIFYKNNKRTMWLTPRTFTLYNHLADSPERTKPKNNIPSPMQEKPIRLTLPAQREEVTTSSFLFNNEKPSSSLQLKAVPYMKLFLQPDAMTPANNQNDTSQYVKKFWEDYKLLNKVNGFAIYFSVHD